MLVKARRRYAQFYGETCHLYSDFALTSTASAQHPNQISEDLAHRDKSIHWPEAFDPRTASVFAHNELLIQADCHRVWSRLLDVTDWPNWFVLTKDVAIAHHKPDGRVCSRFPPQLDTPGTGRDFAIALPHLAFRSGGWRLPSDHGGDRHWTQRR